MDVLSGALTITGNGSMSEKAKVKRGIVLIGVLAINIKISPTQALPEILCHLSEQDVPWNAFSLFTHTTASRITFTP
jgi:hypothetical protein